MTALAHILSQINPFGVQASPYRNYMIRRNGADFMEVNATPDRAFDVLSELRRHSDARFEMVGI